MNRVMAVCAVLAMWIWCLCASGVALAETSGPDLEPEEGLFGFSGNPYEATVSELLLKAHKYRKCQMVFIPSFAEESAVYLLRNDEGHESNATIVSIEMKRQLWIEMMKFLKNEGDGKSYSLAPEAQRRALAHVSHEVRRMEAGIDSRTANLLEKVWHGMLSRVRYPTKNELRLGKDGEVFHAAHFVQGAGYSTGKTWSPNKGTRTYDFVDLAKALRNFAQSADGERDGIIVEVFAKAEALLERLKGDN